MGGIRSAGDLVYRMELQGYKINDAKKYVAEKLGCPIENLADCAEMKDLRDELNIGTTQSRPDAAVGMETKFRIADILGIPINSVNRFKKETGLI